MIGVSVTYPGLNHLRTNVRADYASSGTRSLRTRAHFLVGRCCSGVTRLCAPTAAFPHLVGAADTCTSGLPPCGDHPIFSALTDLFLAQVLHAFGTRFIRRKGDVHVRIQRRSAGFRHRQTPAPPNDQCGAQHRDSGTGGSRVAHCLCADGSSSGDGGQAGITSPPPQSGGGQAGITSTPPSTSAPAPSTPDPQPAENFWVAPPAEYNRGTRAYNPQTGGGVSMAQYNGYSGGDNSGYSGYSVPAPQRRSWWKARPCRSRLRSTRCVSAG